MNIKNFLAGWKSRIMLSIILVSLAIGFATGLDLPIWIRVFGLAFFFITGAVALGIGLHMKEVEDEKNPNDIKFYCGEDHDFNNDPDRCNKQCGFCKELNERG